MGLPSRRAGRARLFAAALTILATLAPSRSSRAVGADASPVVARVGTVTITAAELERRMAVVPGFQLRAFGATPTEIKRSFLERVLVREALLAQGGALRGLGERGDVQERMRGVLRNAMLAGLKAEVLSSTPIDEKEIKAYYDEHATKFQSPERLGLWVIVVQKREEAVEVLAELKKDSSPSTGPSPRGSGPSMGHRHARRQPRLRRSRRLHHRAGFEGEPIDPRRRLQGEGLGSSPSPCRTTAIDGPSSGDARA